MQSVQKIAQGFQSLLTDKKKEKLAGYMQKLGFSDIASSFYELQPESGKRVSKAKGRRERGWGRRLAVDTLEFHPGNRNIESAFTYMDLLDFNQLKYVMAWLTA